MASVAASRLSYNRAADGARREGSHTMHRESQMREAVDSDDSADEKDDVESWRVRNTTPSIPRPPPPAPPRRVQVSTAQN